MEEELMKTQNKGKRKIPIERITDKTKKQVTFSKRRGGLIKKGSELCSLCGANLAIITFSGAGKLFSFGHPNAESVIQRYVNNNSSETHDHTTTTSNDNNGNNVNDFGMFFQQYKDVIGQIDAEKKASTSANCNNFDDFGGFWWNENVDGLGLDELDRFKVALEGLRNEVVSRVEEVNPPSSTSLSHQSTDFGMWDGNMVAHHQGFDGSRANNVAHHQSFSCSRDNNVAHYQAMDNNVAHYQAMDNNVAHYQARDNMAAHHQGFDGARDNMAAHHQGFDGARDNMAAHHPYFDGTRDTIARHQGFDGSINYGIDHNIKQDNFYQKPLPAGSLFDMLTKNEP